MRPANGAPTRPAPGWGCSARAEVYVWVWRRSSLLLPARQSIRSSVRPSSRLPLPEDRSAEPLADCGCQAALERSSSPERQPITALLRGASGPRRGAARQVPEPKGEAAGRVQAWRGGDPPRWTGSGLPSEDLLDSGEELAWRLGERPADGSLAGDPASRNSVEGAVASESRSPLRVGIASIILLPDNLLLKANELNLASPSLSALPGPTFFLKTPAAYLPHS